MLRVASRLVIATALVGLFVLTAASPAAVAHPMAPGPAWETRLLHDNGDDHGGHSTTARQTNGHDLLALDIQEHHDATLGRVLSFRLYLNPGAWAAVTVDPKEVRDEIHFTVDGKARVLEFKTSDDKTFTGTFERIGVEKAYREIDGQQVRKEGNEDGQRRVLVGTSSLDTLDIPVGATLADFAVVGYHGDNEEDVMGDADPADPDDADKAWFKRAAYTVRGPSHYTETTVETDRVVASVGEQAQLNITVLNSYTRAQTVTMTFPSLPGFFAQFHDGERFTEGTVQFDLPKSADGGVIIHLFMSPQEARTETGLLEMKTSLGGYENWTVTFVGEDDGREDPAMSGQDGSGELPGDGGDTGQDDNDETADDENAAGTDDHDNGADGDRQLVPAPDLVSILVALTGTLFLAARRRP